MVKLEVLEGVTVLTKVTTWHIQQLMQGKDIMFRLVPDHGDTPYGNCLFTLKGDGTLLLNRSINAKLPIRLDETDRHIITVLE
jgi:hypothetical protein